VKDRYIRAMKKIKDDTIPKVCIHLQGNSLNDDISKQLPSSNDTIIVQYTHSGQPHMEVIFTEDKSNKKK
jgi:hypothetical protein